LRAALAAICDLLSPYSPPPRCRSRPQ